MYIAWRLGYKVVAYNNISAEVGRINTFFCVCVCSRNCIITIIILNVIMYIVVVAVCQNHQVNGPNKCKHEISDALFYLFYPVLLQCSLKIHM